MPSNAAVAEISNKPLFDLEDDLIALLNSEDGIPPEMEGQFQADLASALTASKEKRERVARQILQWEEDADFARREAQRIQAWALVRDGRAKRLRTYVLGVITALGEDDKGKLRKLEGNTVTMSARACPASLEVTDIAQIPESFKTVTITVGAETWRRLVEAAGPYAPELPAVSMAVIVSKVKAAIQTGHEVQGADLKIGKYALQVR